MPSYLDILDAEARANEPVDQDWDMEAEERKYMARHEDIEAVPEAAIDHGVKFIALDTNSLISHLSRIQGLYDVLQQYGGHQVSLLIPTAVVNELDGLKLKDKTTHRAHSATMWLLNINKAKRETGIGPIRSQKWSERHDASLLKGDDRILDCCLHFQELGAEVVLWTADRNLSLLAEGNDVPALSPPAMASPSVIVQMAFKINLFKQGNIEGSAPERDLPPHLVGPSTFVMGGQDGDKGIPGGEANGKGDFGEDGSNGSSMDLDDTGRSPPRTANYSPISTSRTAWDDRPKGLDHLSHRSQTAPPTPTSTSSAKQPQIAPPPPARTRFSGPPLPTNAILADLDALARYIYAHLPVHPNNPPMKEHDPNDRPTFNAARTLKTLSDTLNALHESMTTLTDADKRNIWLTVGSLNDLRHFVQPVPGRAPCLEYKIRQALRNISLAMTDLGIFIDGEKVQSIMDEKIIT